MSQGSFLMFSKFSNCQVFRFSSFQSFQVPSTCLTFRHFLHLSVKMRYILLFFFYLSSTLPPDNTNHRAGSQLKNVQMLNNSWEPGNVVELLNCWNVEMQSCHAAICQVFMLITVTCWTTFVFMSMLKSHCLWLFVMLSCRHVILSCCHMSSAYVDHWDMLNNFCFHVYAQKSVFMIVCHAVMSCCHMSSAYVDH